MVRGSISGWLKRFFSPKPPNPSYSVGTECFCPRLKISGREADQAPPSSVTAKLESLILQVGK